MVTPKVSAPRPPVANRAISRSQPQAARELVDRDRAAHAVHDARDVMVDQVGADARAARAPPDADRPQMLGRTDAGDLQELRRVDGAAARRSPRGRPHRASAAALAERDADAAPALEDQPAATASVSTRDWPRPRASREKGLRRRAAKAAAPRHLRIADALPLRAVEVG